MSRDIMIQVSKTLDGCPLVSLDLEACDFSIEDDNLGFQHLCDAVLSCYSLTSISFSLCSIPLSQEPFLAKMIENSKSLDRFDLYHCSFDSDSSLMKPESCFLVEALVKNTLLTFIYLPHLNVSGWLDFSSRQNI